MPRFGHAGMLDEKQLKGGRVLGPMERVFVVALGALGDLTAAAVVVAAKGLLRFPELQRAQRQRHPAVALRRIDLGGPVLEGRVVGDAALDGDRLEVGDAG